MSEPKPDGIDEILTDLTLEQTVLENLLAGCTDSDWELPTPSVGWSTRNSVSHLTVVDELAIECVRGDASDELARIRAREADVVTREQAHRADDLTTREIIGWSRAVRAQLRDALAVAPADRRVEWVAGPMALASFTTSRLMEYWAHGLDCFSALGVEPTDTDRIRHVCRLGYRALPYAFGHADSAVPVRLDDLSLSLTLPSGQLLSYGDRDVNNTISGTAGDWARLSVRRLALEDATSIVAVGPMAEEAVRVVRAYA